MVVQEPGRTAHELVDTGYEWVFVRSGLLERMSQTAERARAPSQGKNQDGGRNFRYFISQVYVWTESYLIAAAFTTLTFLVRLLVLALTLPLIFTAAFVGLIDGLVRRDVRRVLYAINPPTAKSLCRTRYRSVFLIHVQRVANPACA